MPGLYFYVVKIIYFSYNIIKNNYNNWRWYNIVEIIWKDEHTGQRFVIDESGEKIFILDDGSRVYESDLILDEMLAAFVEEEEEKRLQREAEEEALAEELEVVEVEEEKIRYYEDWLYYYGPDSKYWNNMYNN